MVTLTHVLIMGIDIFNIVPDTIVPYNASICGYGQGYGLFIDKRSPLIEAHW